MDEDDLVKFIEEEYQTLIEEFLHIYKFQWEDFCETAFSNRGAKNIRM